MELPKGRRGSHMVMILSGVILSCVLQLGAAQRRVSIILKPPKPQEGQDVTLSVQGGPQSHLVCGWERVYHKRALDNHSNGTDDSRWKLSREDCSLTIKKLETHDAGGYSVYIKGNSTRPQSPEILDDPEEVYEGYVYLPVSGKNPQKGGHNHSAGLSYSAGVIAGALLGVFAWTDTLTSLFYGLCATLSWPGRLL
ncbi:carcinoembryonic antigen-related cell adhesion molecule 19-like [Eublepharis macularius]|uniref:Carcinoembryonic antigen-related cell adhesion molecule 19-like n=1 Tax=Eublepharis macularius TaxID=481883 RepID=A0AA97KG26_EUBMA|nr:carcinoembryonic antigen-related cell adhesion molecule 19-like [Eublepharis macularius]